MIGDSFRGLIIALLAVLLTVVPGMPNAPVAPTPVLIGIGLTLQCLLLGVRWFVRRQERIHGVDGAWLPTVQQVGALVADGLTVLLVAIALFQGMLDRATAI